MASGKMHSVAVDFSTTSAIVVDEALRLKGQNQGYGRICLYG